MGYSASGDLTITIPEATAVTIALVVDGDNGLRGCGDNVGPSLVDKIVDATELDCAETETAADGTIAITGYVTEKWTSYLEDALTWLVEHGAGLEGTIVGEDDCSWTYNITPGDNVYAEIGHVRVPETLLVAIREINGWLSTNDASPNPEKVPAGLATLLQDLTDA